MNDVDPHPVPKAARATWRRVPTCPDGRDGTPDPRIKVLDAIVSEFLFDLVVDLEVPFDFGDTPTGRRILYRAQGGAFGGDRLRGEVLPGGGDWATFQRGGRMLLDVRLTLRTHDGALIYMTYSGRCITPFNLRADMADPERRILIDPTHYYFRTTPYFETGAAEYAWLNDLVCVGAGYMVEGGVAYRISRLV